MRQLDDPGLAPDQATALESVSREVDRSFAAAFTTLGFVGLLVTLAALVGWGLGRMSPRYAAGFAILAALGLVSGWWLWRRSLRPGVRPRSVWVRHSILAALLLLTGARLHASWQGEDVLRWLDLVWFVALLVQGGFAVWLEVRSRRAKELRS